MRKLALLSAAFALVASSLYGCDEVPTETHVAPVEPSLARANAADNYELIVLGTLGGDYADASAINNSGQVVGTSESAAGQQHAFLWEKGRMNDLGTLGGPWSRAFDISNSGYVVGESQIARDGPYHAYRWQNGKMEDLGTLGGDWSSAKAVNEAGDAVGFSTTSDGLPRATLWRKGEVVDLGTLGGSWSYAEAINSRGWVVGNSRIDGTDKRHAFIWRHGEMVDLGTLGGAESWAEDINDAGEVTGMALAASGHPRAFMWRGGVMTDMGPPLPPSSNRSSWAAAITNGGAIAGSSNVFSYPSQRACLWSKGAVIDLPTPSWSNAHDINQRGQAVGYGGDAWPYQALLWQPVK